MVWILCTLFFGVAKGGRELLKKAEDVLNAL